MDFRYVCIAAHSCSEHKTLPTCGHSSKTSHSSEKFSLLLKFKDDPPSTFGPPHATTHAYPSITTFLASHSTHWIID